LFPEAPSNKRTHNKALLLTGARQVGKTSAIEKYASEHYDYLFELNFVTTPGAIGFLDGASDAKEMLFRITAISNVPMIPGKTLIFFDEIQEYPDLVTMIKFLVAEGSYQYALSGSLLGILFRVACVHIEEVIKIIETHSFFGVPICYLCARNETDSHNRPERIGKDIHGGETSPEIPVRAFRELRKISQFPGQLWSIRPWVLSSAEMEQQRI